MEKIPTPQLEKEDGQEKLPDQKVFETFLNISPESFTALKDRLSNVQGHGRVWVHPLYTEQWPGSFSGRGNQEELQLAQEQMRTAFLKTVQSVSKNRGSSPLFIYEATKMISGTEKLVADSLGVLPIELADHGVVFVPTFAGGSGIDQEILKQAYQNGNAHDQKTAEIIEEAQLAAEAYVQDGQNFRALVEARFGSEVDPFERFKDESDREEYTDMVQRHFKESRPVAERYHELQKKAEELSEGFTEALYTSLGMKSALVSGVYMESVRNRSGKLELSGCAGSLAEMLRRHGIATDISKNIWPPKERLRELGIELKQTASSPHQ